MEKVRNGAARGGGGRGPGDPPSGELNIVLPGKGQVIFDKFQPDGPEQQSRIHLQRS
jgi:hypothetical protein